MTSELWSPAQAVAERLLASPIFLRSRSVSCYMSMPLGEVQTSALLSATLSSGTIFDVFAVWFTEGTLLGKTLFVPKIDIASERKMDFLKVYDIEDLRTFPSGTWGIKEPDYEWKGHRRANGPCVKCPLLSGLPLNANPNVQLWMKT